MREKATAEFDKMAVPTDPKKTFSGFAVGAMFVREVFHGEAKTQGEIMIDNIRNAFKRNLKNLDWMDSETRSAAEIKADAITDMIGMFNLVNLCHWKAFSRGWRILDG